jgi:hypothetical protein
VGAAMRAAAAAAAVSEPPQILYLPDLVFAGSCEVTMQERWQQCVISNVCSEDYQRCEREKMDANEMTSMDLMAAKHK